jgi:hypothetical protein
MPHQKPIMGSSQRTGSTKGPVGQQCSREKNQKQRVAGLQKLACTRPPAVHSCDKSSQMTICNAPWTCSIAFLVVHMHFSQQGCTCQAGSSSHPLCRIGGLVWLCDLHTPHSRIEARNALYGAHWPFAVQVSSLCLSPTRRADTPLMKTLRSEKSVPAFQGPQQGLVGRHIQERCNCPQQRDTKLEEPRLAMRGQLIRSPVGDNLRATNIEHTRLEDTRGYIKYCSATCGTDHGHVIPRDEQV